MRNVAGARTYTSTERQKKDIDNANGSEKKGNTTYDGTSKIKIRIEKNADAMQ